MIAFDTAQFEIEKNRKAFLYTVIICVTLLLLFFIIRWKILPPPEPVIADLMEINLGNNFDGYSEEQPLVKGHRGPAKENIERVRPQPAKNVEKVIAEEDPNGAPVDKTERTVKKVTTPVTKVPPVPRPQKPKVTYNGPVKGTGNNETTDNGYRYQGTTPGGKGDNGDPNGHPDSYGDTPGGKIGGPKVTKGNRKIIRYYSFTDELPKATIYAIIKVSPSGKGTFAGFDKGSTSRNQGYADAITRHLGVIAFDKSNDESTVTVQFNFNIN